MSCTTYVPSLVEQLHGPDPTAGSDCAIACAKMAIRFATCGKLDPGIDAIRSQAGLDEPNPPPDDFSTTIWEYQTALNKWDDEARGRGFEGIGANVKERQAWDAGETGLAPTIRAEDKWVTVFVDYGVLNDREPSKSGDPGYNGAHAIGVYGYKSKDETGDGTAKARIFDPLCDGRKSSIPKGTTWWTMSTLRDAADAYAGGGSGNATWCVTPRSVPTEPEPEPPDPCDEQLTATAMQLGEAGQELAIAGAVFLLAAARIRELLGGNDEGLELPVRQGVTPDAAD